MFLADRLQEVEEDVEQAEGGNEVDKDTALCCFTILE